MLPCAAGRPFFCQWKPSKAFPSDVVIWVLVHSRYGHRTHGVRGKHVGADADALRGLPNRTPGITSGAEDFVDKRVQQGELAELFHGQRLNCRGDGIPFLAYGW